MDPGKDKKGDPIASCSIVRSLVSLFMVIVSKKTRWYKSSVRRVLLGDHVMDKEGTDEMPKGWNGNGRGAARGRR